MLTKILDFELDTTNWFYSCYKRVPDRSNESKSRVPRQIGASARGSGVTLTDLPRMWFMNGSCACNYARRPRADEIALSRISSVECVMKRDVGRKHRFVSFRSPSAKTGVSFPREADGVQTICRRSCNYSNNLTFECFTSTMIPINFAQLSISMSIQVMNESH